MKNPVITLSLMFVFSLSLQGCVASKHQTTTAHNSALSATESNKPQDPRLNHCVFEARQLAKISSEKYGKINSQLYTAIKEVKYYSSVSKDLSPDTAETLTPFYQFKILDICKDISQSMYAELKDGVMIAPEGSQ